MKSLNMKICLSVIILFFIVLIMPVNVEAADTLWNSKTLTEDVVIEGNIIADGNIDLNGFSLIVKGDYTQKNGKFICENSVVEIEGNLVFNNYEEGKDKKVYVTIQSNKNSIINIRENFIINLVNTNNELMGEWNLAGNYRDLSGAKFSRTSGYEGVLNLVGTSQQFMDLNDYSRVRINAINQDVKFGKFISGDLLSDLTIKTDENLIGIKRELYLNGHTLTIETDLKVYDWSGVTLGQNGNLIIEGDLELNTSTGVIACKGGTLIVKGDFIGKAGELLLNSGKIVVEGNMILSEFDEKGNLAIAKGSISTNISSEIYIEKDMIINIEDIPTFRGKVNIKGNYIDKVGADFAYTNPSSELILCGTSEQLVELTENSFINIKSQNRRIKIGKYFGGRIYSDLEFNTDEEMVFLNKEIYLNGNVLDIPTNVKSNSSILLSKGKLNIGGDFIYENTEETDSINCSNGEIKVNGNYIQKSGELNCIGATISIEGTMVFADYDVSGNMIQGSAYIISDENTIFDIGNDVYYSTSKVYNNSTHDVKGDLYIKGNFIDNSDYVNWSGTVYLCGMVNKNQKQVVNKINGKINKLILSSCVTLYDITEGSYDDIYYQSHNYNEGVITKQSTIKETGIRTFTCSRCEHFYTEDIPVKEVPEHEHIRENIQVVKEATETEEGKLKYTCTICEETFEELIPRKKHSHKWDEGVVTKKATITQEGLKTFTCFGCGETYTEIIPRMVNVYDEKTDRLLRKFYSDCLDRDPDEDGYIFWAQIISSKGDGVFIGAGFVFSEEYCNKNTTKTDYIKMLYRVFLDREADDDGLEYWQKAMLNGKTREEIFKVFVESPEFAKICSEYGINCGEYDIRGIQADSNEKGVVSAELLGLVKRIYDKALNRGDDNEGIAYWSQQIADDLYDLVEVADILINSEEIEEKSLEDSEYITILYEALLGREPDTEGFKYWVEKVSDDKSRKEVFKEFVNCPEFKEFSVSIGVD